MTLQNKKSVTYVVFFSLILGGLIFAFWFLYQEIKLVRSIVNGAEIQIATMQEKEKEFEASSKALKASVEDITILDSASLSNNTFVDFLKLLEDIAIKTKVKFIADAVSITNENSNKASIAFNIEGDLSGVIRFFVMFDNVPYAGIIDRATISSAEEKTKIVRASADYVIFSFNNKQ